MIHKPPRPPDDIQPQTITEGHDLTVLNDIFLIIALSRWTVNLGAVWRELFDLCFVTEQYSVSVIDRKIFVLLNKGQAILDVAEQSTLLAGQLSMI